MGKLIITAAVTGGEPVSREMTPYVPCTAEEIAEETYRCWEADDDASNNISAQHFFKKI